MPLTRRTFLSTAALAGAQAQDDRDPPRTVPDYEKPLFDLHKASGSPVKIASIELLRNGSVYLVRATSADGAAGIARTKQVEDFVPILLNRVIPCFIGKDARDLESMVDGVHVQNYKMAGQAFWCPVAYVEQSLFDLLGKIAGKPAGALMGGVVRKEIPVYLSGAVRETTAEREIEIYARALEQTGARAVKLKIGGRMSRNADAYPGRTRRMMTLARKTFGDKVVIYTDANGSYDSATAIAVGRWLQDLGVAFFEEPCPWEELDETRRVADVLEMPVAGGEQDASLWRFQWMIRNRVVDIVQPDLNYNGGFIRAARVARMARLGNVPITPHNTQTDASGANILQFASAVPNIGPHMEWPYRGTRKPEPWYSPNFEIRDGLIRVPAGPGLGVEYDPAFLKNCRRVG